MASLNHLQRNLPEGLVADSQWLDGMGYSSTLRQRYVSRGWLDRVMRGVFRRPRYLPGVPDVELPLDWRQVVVSLQMVMGRPFVLGGRSALEFAGYGHFVRFGHAKEVHLYGDQAPPGWLQKIPLPTRILPHNATRLFSSGSASKSLSMLRQVLAEDISAVPGSLSGGITWQRVTGGGWPMMLSTPERAALEMLDKLPKNESFEQADLLMENLVNLRPAAMSDLLKDCRSVKAKRLFLWFADRHSHAWLPSLNLADVNLGSGKRVVAPEGRLDPAYGITVPRSLFASG